MREQQDNRIFKTALYLRLSKDDEGKEESASIKSQRSIVTEYAQKNGFLIVDEYVDASDIIGLKQNPANGYRFSPIFSFSAI